MTELITLLQDALGAAYRVDRELGGGGMSRVFLARDATLDRAIVIKLLPEDAASSVSAERFKREIAVAARLQHPHIVPLLSAGEVRGLPFFTMPFIEGESLRERLTREGELPIDEAVQILKEVARALAYAHEHGIVHRDIKPDNVLISGGASMVTDFGVAKAVSASASTASTGLTQLGIALGTPAYMAPEQAAGDGTIDHRADLYALGCMAYEILTGQPPFTGRSTQSLLAAHVTELPEPVQKRRASVPPALVAIVMHCLEKRPADRPKNAAEVLRALDAVVVTPPTTNAYTATDTRLSTPTATGTWLRNPRSIALLAVVALAAVLGARNLLSGARVPSKDVVFTTISFIDGTQVEYERGFALSPDGSRLVFSGRNLDTGAFALWLRPLNSPTASRLTGTEGAMLPFWSPDGRHIGYFANGVLRVRTVDGTQNRVLCPAAQPEGGSWGSRGVIVFAPELRGTIHAVDASGGQCRSVTALAEGVLDHRRPTFLPDGQHFVFGSGSAATMWIGDLETKEQKVLVKDVAYGNYVDPGYLFFANVGITGGRLFAQRLNTSARQLEGDAVPILENLVYSVSARPLFDANAAMVAATIGVQARRSIQHIYRDGRPSREYSLPDKLANAQDFDVSHDGSQLAIGAAGLWLFDVGHETARLLVAGSDTGTVAIARPRWSPHDTAIVYARSAGADLGLRVYNLRTGDDRLLISSPSIGTAAMDWSSDGRWIAYSANTPTGVELFLLDVSTGKAEAILESSAGRIVFSPDAKWIAFRSVETGRNEVYVMNLSTRSRFRVSHDGGSQPVWRGRELFYLVPNLGVVAVTLDLTGDQARVGAPRVVTPNRSITEFHVSRDGREIFGLEYEARRALGLVQNWPALLKH